MDSDSVRSELGKMKKSAPVTNYLLTEENNLLTYVLGALVLLIVVMIIVMYISPEGEMKFLAVGHHSFTDNKNPTLDAIRLSAELELVMLIVAITVAALFGLVSEFSKTSMIVIGLVMLISLIMVLARSFSYERLDLYYSGLAGLYFCSGLLAGLTAYKCWKIERVAPALLLGIIAAIFLLAAVGAGTVSTQAVTGDEAKKFLENMNTDIEQILNTSD